MKRRSKSGNGPAPAPSGSAAAASAPLSVQEPETLGNLQAAYSGETNAHFRYLSFARGADEEGFAPVASLFRAAARSEEIHAKNHAEVIRDLGAEPKANVAAVVVKSTFENLNESVKSEVYERDEMYPSFLHQARSEQNPRAARTFHLAQKAEAVHAALFTEALKELERSRGAGVEYYVCPDCGFTSAKNDGERCPVCSCPTGRFETVR